MLISALTEYKNFCYERDKVSWEQSRMIAQSIIATSQAKEQGKRQMMKQLKFPWDSEVDRGQGLTKEQMQEMKRISEQYHGRKFKE